MIVNRNGTFLEDTSSGSLRIMRSFEAKSKGHLRCRSEIPPFGASHLRQSLSPTTIDSKIIGHPVCSVIRKHEIRLSSSRLDGHQ